MAVDPTSSDFDPLLALYSDDMPSIASSTVKVYDNVAVFEANFKRTEACHTNEKPTKPSRREKSFSQRKKLAAEVQNRDLSKLKAMMEARKKADEQRKQEGIEEKVVSSDRPKRRKPPSNIFVVMEKLSFGPLSLLHRITTERLRCFVYTRNFQGLRGVLVGFVAAFDRYMNLAMFDVDETFAFSPVGDVADHQKKLTVGMLEKALEDIKIVGLENTEKGVTGTKQSSSTESSYRHLPSSGVAFLKPSQKVQERKKKSETGDSSKLKYHPAVQLYRTSAPPNVHRQIFHGGNPQLYHSHIHQLYVRGDSVVLISLPP